MQVIYPGPIGVWRCWFLWRKENRRIQRKTLGARRDPTTNSTHIWCKAGIKPAPHWSEASTLATTPSLLPNICMDKAPKLHPPLNASTSTQLRLWLQHNSWLPNKPQAPYHNIEQIFIKFLPYFFYIIQILCTQFLSVWKREPFNKSKSVHSTSSALLKE